MASGQFIHFRLDRSWMDSRTSYAPLTVRTFGGEKEYPEGMTIVDLGNGVQITKPYYGPSWARLVVNGKTVAKADGSTTMVGYTTYRFPNRPIVKRAMEATGVQYLEADDYLMSREDADTIPLTREVAKAPTTAQIRRAVKVLSAEGAEAQRNDPQSMTTSQKIAALSELRRSAGHVDTDLDVFVTGLGVKLRGRFQRRPLPARVKEEIDRDYALAVRRGWLSPR